MSPVQDAVTVTTPPTVDGWLAGVAVRLPAAPGGTTQSCARTSVGPAAPNRLKNATYVPGSVTVTDSSAVPPALLPAAVSSPPGPCA